MKINMKTLAARVINSLYLWRRGKRWPTDSRKAAVDTILAKGGEGDDA